MTKCIRIPINFLNTSAAFGKGYNAEYRLFVLIERMKEARDIKIKNEPQS